MGAPPPAAAPTSAIPWAAWAAIVAFAAVGIATALEWIAFGELSANAFDVPVMSIVDDQAAGGISIAVVLLVLAGLALAFALLAPRSRAIGITFRILGGVSVLVVGAYIVKALTAESAPGVSLVSYGVWIAAAGAVAAVLFGLALRSPRRA
jgi:hypothetical protein